MKFFGSYSTKPIYIFGGTGLLLLFSSILVGIAVIIMKTVYDIDITGNPLFTLTILLIIMSILFIQLGIMAEVLIRIYHEARADGGRW